MANFGKYTGQSTKGWNSRKALQVVGLGQSVDLGLWGGGPGGLALEVRCRDATLCTVHERPKPVFADWRNFVLTGLKAGSTKIQGYLPGTSSCWAEADVQVAGTAHGIRLAFFPGERSLARGGPTLGAIYVIGGQGERFDAAGGPALSFKDAGGHIAEPTPAGHYTLGPKVHVTTASWPMSVIPWGASLRLRADGEVEFSPDGKRWRLATGRNGEVTVAQQAFLRRDNRNVPLWTVIANLRPIFVDPISGALRSSTWEKNDFGRWGWNLLRSGAKTAYWIHTTPDDERANATGRAVFLANSHGCIHLVPSDRDNMIALRYLQPGVDFEVHRYDESGPP